MTNIFTFLTTSLIWGTTWLAIKFQLGKVHPLWSVCYRFALAGIILLLYCYLRGLNLNYSLRDHKWIALQALFLFSLNYFFYYCGTDYFVSGIVAVIFASVSILNIFNARIFLKTPLSKSAILGAVIGMAGLMRIFHNEIYRLMDQELQTIITGLGICLLGTALASLGQIIATANMRRSLPYLQINAIGMSYGALYTGIGALVLGEWPTFDFTPKYIGSLLYLSIVGTVIAFGLYMKLVHNIGPGKASYANILIPVIALTVSSYFEDFSWSVEMIYGVIMVVLGNVVVMVSKTLQSRRPKLDIASPEEPRKAA
ncbi:DMT family transporter [Candidatus Odyssella thessalonicensis]|uniref:DMT family transporter n=1 Tax=Candidatus Odyssella thessalonicensis TaxID=84647 RepID=UPI000225AEAC|nr:EamA family transporter [Candidatus Odyssella thessalonicensis]